VTKDELIAKLSELSTSDLEKAGLQKKSESKQAESSDELLETLKLKREQARLEVEMADAAQRGTDARMARNQLAVDELEVLKQAYKLKEEEGALNEETTAEFEQQLDLIRQKFDIQGVTLENLGEVQEQFNKKLKEGKKVGDKYSSMMDSLGRKFIIFGKGPLVKATLGIRKLGTELRNSKEAQEMFKQSIVDTFNFTNLFGNLLNVVADSTFTLVKQLDAASTSFAAATGFGGQFTQTMRDAQQQGNYLGVTMDGAAKSMQGLSANFTDFGNISDGARANLVATTAQLSRIGVDAGTSGQMVQFFTQNLGQTSDQAIQTTKEISMMGKTIGLTAGEMTKAFQSALPTLAVYGDRAPQVFKGLAAAAKVAGVEMDKLLGLAGKFDTFAGAAETTGKLNALLGTQLSGVDLLRQSEEQRIETLIETMQLQGRSFKDMGRFQQKAVAAAAGIEDLNEAQRIFGMDLGKYRDYQDRMDQSAKSQAAFEEAVSKTVPIQEKFQLILAEFGVAVVPILESIHGLLQGALDFFNEFTPAQKEMIVGVVAAFGGLFLAAKSLAGIMAVFKTLSSGFTLVSAAAPAAGAAATEASVGISTGINNIGRSVTANASGFLILTFALLGIGAAIFMIGKGIKGVDFGAFAGLSILLITMVGLAVGLAALMTATAGIGGGVVLAGFALLAGGLVAIGLALQQFPTEVMDSISTIMSSLVNLDMESMEAIAGVFTAMAVGLTQLSDTANQLDGKKVKISSVLENLALLSVGTAKDSMTGARIDASAVNVQNNLENILNFDDMKVNISIGGQEFREAVLTVTQTQG
jgi:hypothetical protein